MTAFSDIEECMLELLKIPGAESKTVGGHIFNNDLLITDEDVLYVGSKFPSIAHVLDHPELKMLFGKADDRANSARAHLRLMGTVAILSGAVALLGSVTEALWGHSGSARWISIGFEGLAILAAGVAVGGLRQGKAKKRWLESRLLTERLRQWHFQSLISHVSEIEASCAPPTQESIQRFRTERKKWFEEMKYEYAEGRLDNLLVELCKDSDTRKTWMHPEPNQPFTNDSVSAVVYEAYRALRFDHQISYTDHVLKSATDLPLWRFLKWPLVRQEAWLKTATAASLVSAFLCSLAIIIYRITQSSEEAGAALGDFGKLLAIGVLSFAVLGSAFRAVEDGLGVTKDLERYRAYQAKVDHLALLFDETTDPKGRLRVMKEMELAVVEEMRGFLRTHNDAKYML